MAAITKRLAGILSCKIDGVPYDVAGEVSWCDSVVERTTIKALSGIPGFKEMPFPGFMEATIFDNGGLSVAGFNQLTSSTVSWSLANGKQVIGTGMWCVDTQTVNPEEGTFKVRFEGTNVQEVLI